MATIIPKIFTNAYINNEIVSLNREILKCDSNIKSLDKEISHLKDDSHRASDSIGYMYRTLNPVSKDDAFRVEYSYCREYREKIAEIGKRISQKESEKERLNKQKEGYEVQKSELEALLPKTEEQRTDEHYQRLIEAKNNASTEKDYQHLAKQFRDMNGYENTAELASECDSRYQVLKDECQEKNKCRNVTTYRTKPSRDNRTGTS
jgi:predicted  nucleic acid-binding Zn-ribbon protein